MNRSKSPCSPNRSGKSKSKTKIEKNKSDRSDRHRSDEDDEKYERHRSDRPKSKSDRHHRSDRHLKSDRQHKSDRDRSDRDRRKSDRDRSDRDRDRSNRDKSDRHHRSDRHKDKTRSSTTSTGHRKRDGNGEIPKTPTTPTTSIRARQDNFCVFSKVHDVFDDDVFDIDMDHSNNNSCSFGSDDFFTNHDGGDFNMSDEFFSTDEFSSSDFQGDNIDQGEEKLNDSFPYLSTPPKSSFNNNSPASSTRSSGSNIMLAAPKRDTQLLRKDMLVTASPSPQKQHCPPCVPNLLMCTQRNARNRRQRTATTTRIDDDDQSVSSLVSDRSNHSERCLRPTRPPSSHSRRHSTIPKKVNKPVDSVKMAVAERMRAREKRKCAEAEEMARKEREHPPTPTPVDEQKLKEERMILAYQWWCRLSRPPKKTYIKKLDRKDMECTTLTAKDVDLLPWLPGDFFVNVTKMTTLMATS